MYGDKLKNRVIKYTYILFLFWPLLLQAQDNKPGIRWPQDTDTEECRQNNQFIESHFSGFKFVFKFEPGLKLGFISENNKRNERSFLFKSGTLPDDITVEYVESNGIPVCELEDLVITIDRMDTLKRDGKVMLLFFTADGNDGNSYYYFYASAKTGGYFKQLYSPELYDKVAGLTGKTIYSKTRSWEKGSPFNGCVTGYKYYPLTVTKVTPCDYRFYAYYYRIDFTIEEDNSEYFMNFDPQYFFRSFTLCDPREQYKNISDEYWQAIQQGEAVPGMTPKLVVLALGEPDEKSKHRSETTSYDVWRYRSINRKAYYVLFEDGKVKTCSNDDLLFYNILQ